MNATERAVLAEATEGAHRILAEGHERPRCEHRSLLVVEHYGGGLDDHTTDVLLCRCRQYGVVTTKYVSGRTTQRPMKPIELARYINYKER